VPEYSKLSGYRLLVVSPALSLSRRIRHIPIYRRNASRSAALPAAHSQ
jgi:hypothetical protein